MAGDGTLRRVIRPFSRPHACRFGAPVVDRVDPEIFVLSYFMNCMGCTYCFDSCCQYGVDVDVTNVERLRKHAKGERGLEAFVGVPEERWFTEEWVDDKEFPGGRMTRTRVEDGACVFRNRKGRGCLIHSYALERGIDYHDLKPMVSALFPLTFDYGLLHASNEILDKSLQCYGDGPSLYRGVRDEVRYYFGEALVGELDAFERDALAGEAASK
jgi:hypothetical protein